MLKTLQQYLLLIFYCSCFCQDVCHKEDRNCNFEEKRYLLYDINLPEGFNLRRDVYMRFAILAHKMNESCNPLLNKFHLVLPPWSHMVHWKYNGIPEHIPWSFYFDMESLRKFAPVIEMHEFFAEYPKKYSKIKIDEVYTLQHFEDMFKTDNFEDRMKINNCEKQYEHTFFYYNNFSAKSYKCLSYHGPATKLTELLLHTNAQSILIEHAEVALHYMFGNKLYWHARKSMRFSNQLISVAAEFRKLYLNSTDKEDNTILPEDWQNEKHHQKAKGGPYLGVHLRRKDFVRNRPNEAPNIINIGHQIKKNLEKLELNTVFVATDGSSEEFNRLLNVLSNYKVHRYEPSDEISAKYKDGGAAIIDQIICSHATHFIGTHESTFSFRIQEEREIMGFPTESTFNAFCSDDNKCPKPSVWKIV